MVTKTRSLAAVLLLAVPVLAQKPAQAQLLQELRTKETAAKKDPEQLFAVAKWAADKGLSNDAKRIYLNILKINPDHEGANAGLGNARFEGKWLPAKEAEDLRKKAETAANLAKGLVEVQGIWVAKEEVEDAKLGIYHDGGELVTKEEKVLRSRGYVRHPDTDQLIDPQFADKAQNHLHPIGNEGRWVDEKEADKYHSDLNRPWLVRSAYCTIVSTLPLAQIVAAKQDVDRGYDAVGRLFGTKPVPPKFRPVVIIAATAEEYRTYGTSLGDGTSTWGAFAMRSGTGVTVPNVGTLQGAVCDGTGAIGPYNIRDAAGIACGLARAAAAKATLPVWLRHGCGTYASRFENKAVAAFYAKPHIARGGVKNLAGFFAGFALNGNMSDDELRHNTFQAGLVLDYALDAGDAAAKAALEAVGAAMAAGDAAAAGKAIDALTQTLGGSDSKVQEHLQKLATGG